MKTIRDFFCNTDPIALFLLGAYTLLFSVVGVYAIYTERYAVFFKTVLIAGVLFVIALAVVTCFLRVIQWAQSRCKES